VRNRKKGEGDEGEEIERKRQRLCACCAKALPRYMK